jgi:2-polyprenyl-3-methyl-5-hydroxy-6-metoxy-1,4-benzoquinol methylase
MSSRPDSATDQAVRRTASEYDRIPYRSLPYPLTRPAHVAAIAQTLGLALPAVTTARVLEIGCAGGGNIIPLAAAFPDARFVGIDLSPVQIGQARERAAAAGLANIEWRTGSVTEIDDQWGLFDYIICHGVYSWVPPEVRRAILRVAAERLSGNGAALVSYNVLPGWHLRRVARDAMLAHAAQFDDPVEKLAQARAFLEFLKEHAPEDTPNGQVVRREATILADQSDDYVLHEFLELENSPCTVVEFVAAAEAAGLGYLGDCEYHTLLPGDRGPETAAQLRALAATPVQLEHYIDLVIGRTFRQSILMKPAAVAQAQHGLGSAPLAGLHVAARFVDMAQPGGPGPFVFKSPARRAPNVFRTLTTDSPAIARALAALGNRWPASATPDELIDAARVDDAPREAVAPAVLDLLFRLMTAGMLHLSTVPVRAGHADATRPRGWLLARADADRGATGTVSCITRRCRSTGRAAPCSRCSTARAIGRPWCNPCSS